MTEVDRQRLRELASDPNNNAEAISQGLGLGQPANLYYQFQKDPTLKTIYEEGRREAREQVASNGNSARAKAPRKPRKPSTPPRKERSSKSESAAAPALLKRVWLEFEHIAVYDQVSERFHELRIELRANQ